MKRKEIAEMYFGLVSDVVNAYLLERNLKWRRELREELLSEGYVYLMKAIDTYDPTRGAQFHTYASKKITGHFVNYVRRLLKEESVTVQVSSISDSKLDEGVRDAKEYERGSFELIDYYEPEDEINKVIYHQIIMGNSTYQEVANEFGISKTAVNTRLSRLKKRLRLQMMSGGINFE